MEFVQRVAPKNQREKTSFSGHKGLTGLDLGSCPKQPILKQLFSDIGQEDCGPKEKVGK